MLNNNTRKGDKVFAIVGDRVAECVFENFAQCGKFAQITLFIELAPNSKKSAPTAKKTVFKQVAYCHNSEKLALQALKEKLEKALDDVCLILSQINY